MSRPSRRRWTGWTSRKPSLVRPFPNLGLEQLEARETPATFTWDGGGADNNWGTPANWVGDNAPTGVASAFDDLVFPAGAARLSNNNNIAGATFNSIAFGGSGYTLAGSAITLGTRPADAGDPDRAEGTPWPAAPSHWAPPRRAAATST